MDRTRRSVVSVLPRPRAFREVRVVDRLLCADASGRVVHQHALQEVQAVLAKHLDTICVDHFVVLLPLPLGETALEVWERLDARPVGLSGSTQDAEDLEDFIDLGVAGEERLAGGHLGEDAACAPDVYLDVVLLPREHDLRRSVVSRRDIAGHLRVLDTGKAKVANLQIAVLVDENVGGFQVTVDNAGGVDVFQTTL